MEALLEYKLFIIPMIVIVCAQGIKFIRYTIRHEFNPDYIFAPGHFPSAHSAFVSSLVVMVGYYEGVTGGTFAIAAAFAFITIYDAMRVRMNIGLNGKALNMLVSKLDDIDKKEFPKLKERVGHYASEVAGGVGVGVILTLIIIWIMEVLF